MLLKKRIKTAFVYLLATVLALVCVYPLIFSFLNAFKDNSQIFGSMFSLPTQLNWDNYIAAFEVANMGRGIINSLIITSCSTVMLLFIVSMASFAIARIDFKVNNLMLMFFIVGIMVPIHSTLIPLVKIVNRFNGTNSYLTMILLYVTFQLPMSIFLVTSFMKGIDKGIEESAIMDGCGYFRLLTQIIMPLSVPVISTAAIIAFLFIYNELIFAVLFLTKKSMFTLSLCMLSFYGERSNNYGPIYASIIISILPMIVIYLLMQEKVEKGLSAGAIKE